MKKSFPDRFIGHRRYPQPFDWLTAVCLFQNPARHQFAFPSGVCGNNDLSDIFPVQLRLDVFKLLGGLLDDDKLHFFRHHRQSIEFPLLVFFIIDFRVGKGY